MQPVGARTMDDPGVRDDDRRIATRAGPVRQDPDESVAGAELDHRFAHAVTHSTIVRIAFAGTCPLQMEASSTHAAASGTGFVVQCSGVVRAPGSLTTPCVSTTSTASAWTASQLLAVTPATSSRKALLTV